MERPEHNTYDFPDDIETIFDVCDDIELVKSIADCDSKEEYLKLIRDQHCGTDIIYLELSALFYFIDEKRSEYYENLISKEYQTEIA